jgi:hypothetical protein
MATQTQVTKKMVQSIMSNRNQVTEQHVGKKLKLTIVGGGSPAQDVKTKDGELVQSVVETGTVAQKVIFNLNASSSIAMANPINRQLLKDGVNADIAGEAEVAHENFRKYLNATQISFSVFTTDRVLDKLGDRVDITAEIVKITTENGSLLTIDPKTIKVVEYDAPSKVAFSFDLDEETPEVTPEGGETPETVLNGGEKTPEADPVV